MQNLEITVGRTTVRHYRLEALRRPPSPRWRTFLRLHAPQIWATDLFTVQTLTLRTFYVLLVVSHDRRRIEHWNVTRHPTAAWILRQIVEATPWGKRPRYLIRDRDASYGRVRQAGIPYQLQHHPQVFTAQEIAEADHVSGDRVAKVVMVQADEFPIMLLLPASGTVPDRRPTTPARSDTRCAH